MRYFLAIFALLALVVVTVAGFRGGLSRRPPLEVFPDMDRQPKLRPQAPNDFFREGLSSRLHPEGAVVRSRPIQVADALVYPFEDHPLNTGKVTGTTNFVELNPLPITAEFMARGRARFQISCLPCHGALGDGKGITTKFGMTVIGNFHDPRLVGMTDGEIFNTVSLGKNLMQGYAANIAVEDRWAIIAYVRALQLSQLATADDLPAAQRAALGK